MATRNRCPYLDSPANREQGAIDIVLEVWLQTAAMRHAGQPEVRLMRSNYRDAYWTLAQLVAHHTINGCNLGPGDLLGSGTMSGPDEGQGGSLLELAPTAARSRSPCQMGRAAPSSRPATRSCCARSASGPARRASASARRVAPSSAEAAHTWSGSSCSCSARSSRAFRISAPTQASGWGGEFVTVQPHPLFLVGDRHSPWMLASPGQGLAVHGQVFGVDEAALALMTCWSAPARPMATSGRGCRCETSGRRSRPSTCGPT